MFYAHFVLARKGPLARIWLAAHWANKLTKAQVLDTDLSECMDGIMRPKVKLALRTKGHLLFGVAQIYARKAKYLVQDCTEAVYKIKLAYRPGMVDLPQSHLIGTVSAITLPEKFYDFDTALPSPNDVVGPVNESIYTSSVENITLQEEELLLHSASQPEESGTVLVIYKYLSGIPPRSRLVPETSHLARLHDRRDRFNYNVEGNFGGSPSDDEMNSDLEEIARSVSQEPFLTRLEDEIPNVDISLVSQSLQNDPEPAGLPAVSEQPSRPLTAIRKAPKRKRRRMQNFLDETIQISKEAMEQHMKDQTGILFPPIQVQINELYLKRYNLRCNYARDNYKFECASRAIHTETVRDMFQAAASASGQLDSVVEDSGNSMISPVYETPEPMDQEEPENAGLDALEPDNVDMQEIERDDVFAIPENCVRVSRLTESVSDVSSPQNASCFSAASSSSSLMDMLQSRRAMKDNIFSTSTQKDTPPASNSTDIQTFALLQDALHDAQSISFSAFVKNALGNEHVPKSFYNLLSLEKDGRIRMEQIDPDDDIRMGQINDSQTEIRIHLLR